MFEHHFIVRGKDVGMHARHYLAGVMSRQRRKNIECIEAEVAHSDYQGMQQFISDSPWDHATLMNQVACEADAVLGGYEDSGLYLDETSFVKKGKSSAGVRRQYCGRLGKLENCQVGVFACLGRGSQVSIVDFRLFLPEDWTQDPARCDAAKIPRQEQQHRSKTQLALEMVLAARGRGSRHAWIGGDALYGNNQELCNALDGLGETYLMDVANNLRVWDADPQPVQPQPPAPNKNGSSKSRKGRPASRRVAGNPAAKRSGLRQFVAEHFEQHARTVVLRQSTQGELKTRIWVREIWLWNGEQAPPRRRLLVARQEPDGSFKYSLSNAPVTTSWERLARMQAQRYWIEHAFGEAKGELGMAHYEVRGWRGWHHHMALVALAQLFTVKERAALREKMPLLSARDIVELLDHYLPKRERTTASIFKAMKQRHQRRAQAAKSYASTA